MTDRRCLLFTLLSSPAQSYFLSPSGGTHHTRFGDIDGRKSRMRTQLREQEQPRACGKGDSKASDASHDTSSIQHRYVIDTSSLAHRVSRSVGIQVGLIVQCMYSTCMCTPTAVAAARHVDFSKHEALCVAWRGRSGRIIDARRRRQNRRPSGTLQYST